MLDDNDLWPQLAAVLRNEPGHVVSLIDDHALLSRLNKEFPQTRLFPAAGHLDKIARTSAAEFLALIRRVPHEVRWGTRTLAEHLRFDSINLWWLTEVFAKRADRSPVFARFCQIELIRRTLTEVPCSSIVYLGNDPAFFQTLENLGFAHGIPTETMQRPKWNGAISLTRNAASALVWLARSAVQTLLARRMSESSDCTDRICFHSVYPLLWRNGVADEKYGGTFDAVLEQERDTARYVFTLSDGSHQSLTVAAYRRTATEIRYSDQGSRGALLEAYLTAADMMKLFRSVVKMFIVSMRMERSARLGCGFMSGSLNLGPLFIDEIRKSVLRVPMSLAHVYRTRRFVERERPRALVLHFFEYPLGRAMIMGGRQARRDLPIVAVQEGPLSIVKFGAGLPAEPREPFRGQLGIVPIADLVLLEGEGAQSCLESWGYPRETLRVAGAPRLDNLIASQHVRPSDPDPLVLAALGQSGGRIVVELLVKALQQLPHHVRLMIKPHPRGDLSEVELSAIIDRAPAGRVVIERGPALELINRASVVVGTYSSVIPEAVALGRAVILILLSSRINPSPLLDVDFVGVRSAADSGELVAAMQELIDTPPSAVDRNGVIRHCFARLDGAAHHRWADAIVSHVAGPPQIRATK